MNFTGRVVQQFERIVEDTEALLTDPVNNDFDDSINLDYPLFQQDIVVLDDLFNCPEFMEEQKYLMLQFEAAKLRSQDEVSPGPQPQRQENRRSRRSSIGIKLNCPVCLESLSSVKTSDVKMVTECGHVFCQSCIEDVCKVTARYPTDEQLQESGTKAPCPVCRKEVGELRKVYF